MSAIRMISKIMSGVFAATLVFGVFPVLAGDAWTLPSLTKEPPLSSSGKFAPFTYKAIDSSEVTKKWNICFNVIHAADPAFVGYLYGAISQAERLGVKLTVTSAGGYGNLDKQISQVEDCVTQGADAIALMSISPEGNNPTIDSIRKKGVIVVDAGNGTTADVDGRVVADWYYIGRYTGDWLADKHPKGSGIVKIVFLPGPPGVNWVEVTVNGIKDAIADSDIELAKVMYGQNNQPVQMKLVEDALLTYPDIDYIVGGPSAIEPAMVVLREKGRKDIKLVTAWSSPGVEEEVRRGNVLVTVSERGPMIFGMAIDMAVQLLEQKASNRTPSSVDAAPTFVTIDQANVNSYDRSTAFAPKGWKPKFTVE